MVLAAGAGRRLESLTEDLPKTLLPVDGDRTILDIALGNLRRAGMKQVVVVTGYAAERVPVGLVSGAFRAEIEPVLAAAGLTDCFRAVVTAEDVAAGKPAPDGYTSIVGRLGDSLAPADVVAFEDTEAGVASAKAAGLVCVGVVGTLPPERLAQQRFRGCRIAPREVHV